jgi:hypothetical protein
MNLALAGRGRVQGAVENALLRARGVDLGSACLLVCGWEGAPADVARRRAAARDALRRSGPFLTARGAGEKWRASRFAGAHLRDDLMDRGVLVETLETAAPWARLDAVRGVIVSSLRETLGERCHVGAHVSHVYATGASVYVTVLAAQDPADPGVLVLSKFAGAAQYLREALLVNPYDGEETAEAMHLAREMRIQERRRRHEALMRRINLRDVSRWRRDFIAALQDAPAWRKVARKPG